jgi:hypothetical protein
LNERLQGARRYGVAWSSPTPAFWAEDDPMPT